MELAVVQVASSLEPADNLAGLVDLPEADLVVLPEAYARDFGPPGSDVAPFAQGLEGPFVTALVEAAGGRTLVAGMFERSEDSRRPFNTVVVVDSGGVVAAYRKIHLYDSFGYQESLALSAGATDQKVTFDVAGVCTGVLTCYDLRFPELARTYAGEVDLLVVPAAWVAGPRKVRHWRTLLVARAIENVAFVAGAAQAGPRYSGNSLVVDPRGDLVVEAGIGPETVMAAIDTALVAEARRENPSLDNRRL